MSRVSPYVRWGLLAASVSLILLGCRDTPPLSPLQSMHVPPQRMLTELQVDPSDTWLAADIVAQTTTTVYTDQPITDPLTGASTTVVSATSPVENITLYGGFDASGQLQASIDANLDPDPNADPGTQVVYTRITGYGVAHYDGYGRQVSNYASDGTYLPTLTAEDLWIGGSMTDGTIVDDPTTVVDDPTLVDQPDAMMRVGNTDLQLANAIAAVSASIRHRVEQPDDATLIVVQEVDDAAMTPFAAQVRGLPAALVTAGDTPGTTTITRTYKRKAKKEYVLEEIRAERERRTGAARVTTVHTMKYRNVKWNKNKAKDADRASKEPPPVAKPSRGGNIASIIEPTDDVPPPPPPPTGPDLCFGIVAPERTNNVAGTGQHIVVQHGFSESGCLYRLGRTRGDLRNQLRFDDDFIPSLDYGARISDQASALAPRVVAGRPDNQSSIFIGYSNGGLVSRQIGQWNPSQVRGVVTVSTPHGGVPALRTGYVAIRLLLAPVVVTAWVSCHLFGVLCDFSSVEGVLGKLVQWFGIGGDGRPVPVLQDVIDGYGGSGYLGQLNSGAETFARTGIVQQPRQRWLFRRVGRKNCGTDFFTPCGRKAVEDMDNYYARLRSVAVVHWTWNPFKLAARIVRAAGAATAMGAFNGIDGLFNFVLAPAPGDGSDGLVPFSSQRYRNPTFPSFHIPRADSHAEAFGSDLVTRTALVSVLTDPSFGVNRK